MSYISNGYFVTPDNIYPKNQFSFVSKPSIKKPVKKSKECLKCKDQSNCRDCTYNES